MWSRVGDWACHHSEVVECTGGGVELLLDASRVVAGEAVGVCLCGERLLCCRWPHVSHVLPHLSRHLLLLLEHLPSRELLLGEEGLLHRGGHRR